MQGVCAWLIWICHTYSMTGNLSLNGCLRAMQSPLPFMTERVFMCGWVWNCVCAHALIRTYLHVCVSAHVCVLVCLRQTLGISPGLPTLMILQIWIYFSSQIIFHSNAAKIAVCVHESAIWVLVVNMQAGRLMFTSLMMLWYIALSTDFFSNVKKLLSTIDK